MQHDELPYLFGLRFEIKSADIASSYAKLEPMIIEGYKQIADYYK